jgi:hypothetical protein
MGVIGRARGELEQEAARMRIRKRVFKDRRLGGDFFEIWLKLAGDLSDSSSVRSNGSSGTHGNPAASAERQEGEFPWQSAF